MKKLMASLVILFICFCTKNNDAVENEIKKEVPMKKVHKNVLKFPINMSLDLKDEFLNLKTIF